MWSEWCWFSIKTLKSQKPSDSYVSWVMTFDQASWPTTLVTRTLNNEHRPELWHYIGSSRTLDHTLATWFPEHIFITHFRVLHWCTVFWTINFLVHIARSNFRLKLGTSPVTRFRIESSSCMQLERPRLNGTWPTYWRFLSKLADLLAVTIADSKAQHLNILICFWPFFECMI